MMSRDEALRARKMLHMRRSPDEIVAQFSGRYTFEEIGARVRYYRSESRQRYQTTYASKPRQGIIPKTEKVVPPPPEVWAELDRASLVPQSNTAKICGDPIGGRSALDRILAASE